MAYVISEPCIGTKDASCVDVVRSTASILAPNEPGFDAAEQLFIDPEECIDCDACIEACPVDAITSADSVPPEWRQYVADGTPPSPAARRVGPSEPVRLQSTARP